MDMKNLITWLFRRKPDSILDAYNALQVRVERLECTVMQLEKQDAKDGQPQ